MNYTRTILTSLALTSSVIASAQQLTLHIDQAQKDVSPTLYGMMTEEINYSYEGGLYGQLLRNATFREDKHGRRPNPGHPGKAEVPSIGQPLTPRVLCSH